MANTVVSNQEKNYPEEYSLISTTMTDSTITYANEHFCEVAGYQQQELEGQYHNVVRHPDMPKAAFKDMWQHLKKNKSWMGLVKNRCKDGRYYWVNAYVTPIVNEQGQVYEFQSVRTKPDRDVIERAEQYYRQINQNRLPFALRWSLPSVTTVWQGLSALTFAGLCIEQALDGVSGAGLVAMGTTIVQFGLGFWLAKKLRMMASLSQLVTDSDLTTVLYTGRRDDLARIEFALRHKQAELSAVVGRAGDTCNTILLAAENDAANIKTITENVQQQSEQTEQLATAIEQMSSSIREVSNSAGSASELAAAACETAEEGKASMEATVRVVHDLHEELDHSKAIIQQLEADAQQINGILDVITSIADQTNLLALNAAIEAARVGEQGRGFAVVADEVRQLALKSRHSSNEIHEMISRLQGSAASAVTAMEQGADLSVSCRERADQAGRIFEQINQKLNLVTDASHQIAAAVEEQATVTDTLNQGIRQIRDLAHHNHQHSEDATDRIDQLVERLQGVVRLIRQFRH